MLNLGVLSFLLVVAAHRGLRWADVWRTSTPLGIVAAPSESRALPGASPPPTPPRGHDRPRRRRRASRQAARAAPRAALCPHHLGSPWLRLRRAICPTIIAPRAKRTARRRSSMRCAPWWRRCEGILPRSGPSSGPTRRPCTSRRGPRRPRRMRLYPPCPACDHVFPKLSSIFVPCRASAEPRAPGPILPRRRRHEASRRIGRPP